MDLQTKLRQLKWLPCAQNAPPAYPKFLPWYKSGDFTLRRRYAALVQRFADWINNAHSWYQFKFGTPKGIRRN